MPKISVIMPVYNTPETYLRTAINSILSQTFKDFEFIIINDGSTNNVEEVIHSYKDKRIKYYKNKTNLKIIKTLNRGLSLANGEYIARMDADDISFRMRFEIQNDFLDSNPEIGLVNAYCYKFPSRQYITPPTKPSDIELFLKYDANCIVHPLVMFRNQVVKDNNLEYSEKYLHAEDYKMWLDFVNVSKIITLNVPLLLYRDNMQGVSTLNQIEQYNNSKRLIFETILKDLHIEDSNLIMTFRAAINGAKLSLDDYFSIEKVLTMAMKNIKCHPDYCYMTRTIGVLNDFKLYLFNSCM